MMDDNPMFCTIDFLILCFLKLFYFEQIENRIQFPERKLRVFVIHTMQQQV